MANSTLHNIYNKRFNEAHNNIIEEDYRAMSVLEVMYISAVTSTFKWSNLPEGVLSFSPERYLCYWGLMGMLDNEGKPTMFPCFPSGHLLENGEYSDYTFVTLNAKSFTRKREDIAICYNNSLATPSIGMINEFVNKSATALRAVDSALERSMMPLLFYCHSENEKELLDSMYDRTKNQLPFRTVMTTDFVENLEVFNNAFDSRQYDLLSMWDVYIRYRNMFYTTFGINNIEIQKRERLTEAEGTGNDEITRYTLLHDMYERRKNFIEEANEKFGTSLEIEINRDSATVYNEELDNLDKIDDIQLNILKGINTKAMGTEYTAQSPEEKIEGGDSDER